MKNPTIAQLRTGDVNPELVEMMVNWRNKSRSNFLDQRKVTKDSTSTFLRNYVSAADAEFFTLNYDGRFLGHIGLKDLTLEHAWLDNLMVGSRVHDIDSANLLMKHALQRSFEHHGLRTLHLKLLSKNVLVKKIHESLGGELYDRKHSHPLIHPSGTVLQTCEDADCRDSNTGSSVEFWLYKNYLG